MDEYKINARVGWYDLFDEREREAYRADLETITKNNYKIIKHQTVNRSISKTENVVYMLLAWEEYIKVEY